MVKKVQLVAVALSLSLLGLHAQTPYFHYFSSEPLFLGF